MRPMWYFAHCDLMSLKLISTLAGRAETILAAQPQSLRLTVLSSPPWSVNVIRVIHLTPSLVWLNYLAFLWTAKLIPCDFNKLRAEGGCIRVKVDNDFYSPTPRSSMFQGVRHWKTGGGGGAGGGVDRPAAATGPSCRKPCGEAAAWMMKLT